MSVYYLDTSAAVKRYVNETGSNWIRNLVTAEPRPLLISSRLLVVEIASAFARRVRENNITPTLFQELQVAFEEDCQFDYQLVDVSIAIMTAARDLVNRYPLRALDALHLASALHIAQSFQQARLPEPIFLSADERLNQAAQSEGLRADNPNQH